MKSTKRKSHALLEKEAAERQAAKNAVWQMSARKAGKATRHHFVSMIRKAHGGEFGEAEKVFEAAAAQGVFAEAGMSESGVRFWRLK